MEHLSVWSEIRLSEFPFEVFPKEVADDINLLAVLYKLIGWNVKVKHLLTRNDGDRYSVEFKYDDMRILFTIVLNKGDKSFIRCHFSFFALIGTVKYDKIYEKYGIYKNTNNINETSDILNDIKGILDDLEVFVI